MPTLPVGPPQLYMSASQSTLKLWLWGPRVGVCKARTGSQVLAISLPWDDLSLPKTGRKIGATRKVSKTVLTLTGNFVAFFAQRESVEKCWNLSSSWHLLMMCRFWHGPFCWPFCGWVRCIREASPASSHDRSYLSWCRQTGLIGKPWLALLWEIDVKWACLGFMLNYPQSIQLHDETRL